MAARIRGMRVGGPVLELENAGERAKALAIAKTLRDAGVIDFVISTKPSVNGSFTAAALPV